MNEIIDFNLRIPEELNEKIKEIALEEGRSKNKQIEFILKEYVKKYENQNVTINQKHNYNATVNIENK